MQFPRNINIVNSLGSLVNQTTFNEIVQLTDQMLNSAKDAQWDDLFSQEKRRDALIKKYFIDATLNDETLAESIRQVLDKDQEIQSQVRLERNRIAQELKKVTQGKNAIQSYANVG